MKIIRARINGEEREFAVSYNETLLEVLRDRLGLKAAKQGCGEGRCGACTVLLNGEAVNSCLILAVEINGCEVTTLEGLKTNSSLHPLQESFVKEGAIQCGFCTPGMIMAAKALLDRIPDPKEDEIRNSIAGNLCRCTGYEQILRAVKNAAKKISPPVHP